MSQSGSTQHVEAAGIDAVPPAWAWREVGIVVGMVFLGAIASTLLLRVGSAVTGQERAEGLASPLLYGATIIIYGLLLVGIYLFAARRSGWAAVGVTAPPVQSLVLTVPLLLVLTLSGIILINLTITVLQGGSFENPQIEALTGGQPLSSLQVGLLFLLLAVLVPIAEELFFRGMIYPLLRWRWGRTVAIVLSAAIFAVAHVIPLLMPALFFVGLVLGQLREWSKSIIPGILIHATQNAIALLAIHAALTSTG